MDVDQTEVDDWQEDGSAIQMVPGAVPPAEVLEPPTVANPVAAAPIVAVPVADTETLEEHEDTEAKRRERDGRGRFKHRAESQRANPADVPKIAELTKRLREAEAAAGADIVQEPGESTRVFELRRRAELAERRAAETPTPKPATQAATAVAPFVPPPIVAAPAMALPPVKAAKDDPEPDPTKYDDLTKYFRDQAMWAGREALREAHTADTARRQTEQAHATGTRLWEQFQASMAEGKAKYPDYADVAYKPFVVPGLPHITEIPQQSVIDDYIRTRPGGGLVLYALKKNPAEFARIWNLSDGVEQFEALALLRQQAMAPVATPKPVSAPVTKPPSPIRTSPHAVVSEPDDNESLEAFEKRYERRDRRRG